MKLHHLLAIGLIGLTVSLSATFAIALPPFNKEWNAKYVAGNPNVAFVTAADAAKCNVCHIPMNKKMRGEYGTAVSLYLSKADYDKVKGDPMAAKAYINDGLTRAEAGRASDGRTFLQRITAGNLP